MQSYINKLFYFPPWDWIAAMVAFFSFIIAILALIVAVKTLKSQKETEKNTKPPISTSIQDFLLCQILIRLFDGYMRINAIKKILNELNFKYYLPVMESDRIKIDDRDIHVDLYYSEKEKYIAIRGLLDSIRTYNKAIDVLFTHQKDSVFQCDSINNEIDAVLRRSNNNVGYLERVFYNLFDYDTKKICDVIHEIIPVNSTVINNEDPQEDDFNYGDSAFAELFAELGENEKAKLITFMNYYTFTIITQLTSEVVSKKQ